MLKSDENIIYLSKSVKISTKDVHATTVLCITPKNQKIHTQSKKKKKDTIKRYGGGLTKKEKKIQQGKY